MRDICTAGLLGALAGIACHAPKPRDGARRAEAPMPAPTPSVASPAPFDLRLVATLGAPARIHAWGGARLVLDAGVLLYEASDAGLTLLGTPNDYAHDARGNDLVGLATRPPLRTDWGKEHRRVRVDERGVLVAEGDVVRAWDGSRWRVRGDIRPESVASWREDEDAVPDPLPGDLAPAPTGCRAIPSADGHGYVTCRGAPFVPLRVAPEDRGRSAYFSGRAARDARASSPGLHTDSPKAVARDGALWFAEDGALRVAAMGDAARDLAWPGGDSRGGPRYVGEFDDIPTGVTALVGGAPRYWQATWLEAEPAPAPRDRRVVTQILPMSTGSVWIVVSERVDSIHWSAWLYRWGPAVDAAPAPSDLGTVFDQQVRIRDAVGPRPWERSCPQAFVEAELAPEALVATVRAIDAREGSRVAVHIVEGAVGERPVRGVLLYLRAPSSEEAPLDRIVSAVAAAGQGATAPRWCSVPVVTRVHPHTQRR